MELDNLRKEIDKIDNSIVELISKRIEIVKKVAEFKKQNNLQIIDNKRFDAVLKKVENIAKKNNISSNFIKKVYNLIHDYMCDIEKNCIQ